MILFFLPMQSRRMAMTLLPRSFSSGTRSAVASTPPRPPRGVVGLLSGRPPSLFLHLTVLAIFFCCSSIRPVEGFAVGLRFNHTECFHKEIAAERAAGGEDKLVFTVVGAYVMSKDKSDLNLDDGADDGRLPKVEVTVTQPDGTQIFRDEHAKSRGDIRVEGEGVGHYSICFTNVGTYGRWTWFTDQHNRDYEITGFVKVLYFQPVHNDTDKLANLVSRKRRAPQHPKGDKSSGKRGKILDRNGAHDVKVLALNLEDEVNLMREELAYLKARALRHKKTADSNARRTLYWTVIEVAVLVLVAAIQVLTVRYFFNKDSARHNKGPTRVGGPGTMGGMAVGAGGFGGVDGFAQQMVPQPPGMMMRNGGGGGGGGSYGGGDGGGGGSSSYGVGGSSVYGGNAEGLGNRYRSTA